MRCLVEPTVRWSWWSKDELPLVMIVNYYFHHRSGYLEPRWSRSWFLTAWQPNFLLLIHSGGKKIVLGSEKGCIASENSKKKLEQQVGDFLVVSATTCQWALVVLEKSPLLSGTEKWHQEKRSFGDACRFLGKVVHISEWGYRQWTRRTVLEEKDNWNKINSQLSHISQCPEKKVEASWESASEWGNQSFKHSNGPVQWRRQREGRMTRRWRQLDTLESLIIIFREKEGRLTNLQPVSDASQWADRSWCRL